MELRKIFLTFIFLIFINTVKAEMIEPVTFHIKKLKNIFKKYFGEFIGKVG